MPNQKELELSFHDIFNPVPSEARWAAMMAAETVLRDRGVTLEECARVGANDTDFQVGEVVSFFDPANRIANAWNTAVAAAGEAIDAPDDAETKWRLRIVEKPVQLPN